MKSITINGSQRESVGKVSSKALRNAGQVPCVLYGGDQPLHFSADEPAFKNLIYTPDVHTVEIVLEDGKKQPAILQDIQFHPINDKILHVDFYRLFENKEITLEVPVKIIGKAPGILSGGTLVLNNRKLKIKALPKNLPDYVEADINGLEMGNRLYVTELKTNNFKILHPDNTVVCQVKVSRAALKAAQDAAKEASTPKKK